MRNTRREKLTREEEVEGRERKHFGKLITGEIGDEFRGGNRCGELNGG